MTGVSCHLWNRPRTLESYREAYIGRVQQLERSERDDLQRRLALSEARHQQIVEEAEALITAIDRNGKVLLFNRKCERLTGISRTAAVGASWLEIFVQPQDQALVRERPLRALAGEGIQRGHMALHRRATSPSGHPVVGDRS